MKTYIYLFYLLSLHKSVFGWFEYQRALSALENNDLESASEFMGAALLDKPFDPSRLYDAGVIAYKKGDFKQARDYFSASSDQAGSNEKLLEKVHFNAGNAEFKLNELEKAVEQYDLTLAINPDNEQALANRKMVAVMLEKKREEEKKDQKKKGEKDKRPKDPAGDNEDGLEKDDDGDTSVDDESGDDHSTGEDGNSDDQESEDDDSDSDDDQQKENGQPKKGSQNKQNKDQNSNKNSQPQKSEDPFGESDPDDQKEAGQKEDGEKSGSPQEGIAGQEEQSSDDDSGSQQALNVEDVEKEVRDFLARQQQGLEGVDPMLQEIAESQKNRDKELNKEFMHLFVGDKGKRNAKQLW